MFIIILIIIFILFLFFDFDYDYDVCFRESVKDGNADEDGCCGLVGGDHNTDYLQYGCIGCPYLKHVNKEENNICTK